MTMWMASSEGAGAASRQTGVVGAVEAGGARAGHGASEDGGGPRAGGSEDAGGARAGGGEDGGCRGR
jgi:hypothetical protein